MDEFPCDAKASLVNRKSQYDVFARIFQAEIGEDFIEALKNLDIPTSEHLDRFLASCAVPGNSVVAQELACDFSRLFLGMSARPVSPYESVFLSEEHLLMQEQRDEMVELYRTEEMGVSEDFRLPEDHLAVELSFMSYLCGKSLRAIERDDHDEFTRLEYVQREVVGEHLGRWIPLFAQQVAERESAYSDEPSFYAAIAEMLNEFIVAEVSCL